MPAPPRWHGMSVPLTLEHADSLGTQRTMSIPVILLEPGITPLGSIQLWVEIWNQSD